MSHAGTALPESAISLEKMSDAPHHGLKLLVSPQDIPLPLSEACGAASWQGTEGMLRELVKLPTAKEQHACCLNWINLLMKLMTFQVTASESESIIEGPPMIVTAEKSLIEP